MMIVMMWALARSVIGQTTVENPLWMVSSKDDLNRYTMSIVDGGYTSINSAGIVAESSTETVVSASVRDRVNKLEILDELNGQQMTFSLARPTEDEFYLFTCLYDIRGRALYYGSSNSGKLELGKGGWQVPASMLGYKLGLAWRIPIYLDDVVSAKVLIRDEKGNLRETKWLEVADGEISFETQYTGVNGEIAVTTEKDGVYKTIVAPLRRGEGEAVIPDVFVIPYVDANIEGVYDFGWSLLYTDILQVQPESKENGGIPPVVRLQADSARQFFMVAQTTSGEIPKTLYAKNLNTGEELSLTVSNFYSVVNLPSAGLWEIWFDWPNLDSIQYQWWWDVEPVKG